MAQMSGRRPYPEPYFFALAAFLIALVWWACASPPGEENFPRPNRERTRVPGELDERVLPGSGSPTERHCEVDTSETRLPMGEARNREDVERLEGCATEMGVAERDRRRRSDAERDASVARERFRRAALAERDCGNPDCPDCHPGSCGGKIRILWGTGGRRCPLDRYLEMTPDEMRSLPLALDELQARLAFEPVRMTSRRRFCLPRRRQDSR